MSCSLTCSICCEKYKSTDEIYSTSCGHVYHLQCMMQWKSRSSSCPQCRTHNPQSHKIYLDIKEMKETELNKENETLKQQLQEKVLLTSNLEQSLKENELKFKELMQEKVLHISNLEHKLNASETELKSQLEERVLHISNVEHQLEQSENNFFESQKQCTNYDDEIAQLNNTIRYLKIQNAAQEKDILAKIKEIKTLKEELQRKAANSGNADSTVAEMAMRQKIVLQEQKLAEMSMQLANEMRNSIELSLEKSKLQNLIKQQGSIATNMNNQMTSNTKNLVKVNHFVGYNNNNSAASTPSLRADNIDDNNRSIIIKNISNMSKQTQFTTIVTELARKMNVNCTPDNIEKAFVLQKNFYMRNNIQPNTLTLVVEFRNYDLKRCFLANKHMLRNYPETSQIIINEYINDYTNPLFHYANTLRQDGYKFVYCKNGSVFARKDTTTSPIKIRNNQHVDDLKQEAHTNADPDFSLED